MSDLEDSVRSLEDRVKTLEDQLALYRLVSTYGPAVDTGSSAVAGALWADDGVYEFDTARLDGPGDIAAMVESEGHQALIRNGCAHVLAPPIVSVDGDTAEATGYSRVPPRGRPLRGLAGVGQPLEVRSHRGRVAGDPPGQSDPRR